MNTAIAVENNKLRQEIKDLREGFKGACFACEPVGEQNAKIRAENEKLKHVIREIMWMAKRYADNRSTFAPTTFNEAVMILDESGLGDLYTGDSDGRWAKDGMFGEWNPETKSFKGEAVFTGDVL